MKYKTRHSPGTIRRIDLLGLHMEHFACFNCRKRFKQPGSEGTSTESGARDAKCPQCEKLMSRMGKDFHAPPSNDKDQWLKIELLYEFGYIFDPQWDGPGYRPNKLGEVIPFLAQEGHSELEAKRKLKEIREKRR